MRLLLCLGAFLAAVCGSIVQADEPSVEFPLIKGYGGVARIEKAAEPPRAGAKVVFDITVDSKPDEVNRGIESVARYLNLCGQAGLKSSDVKLSIVLHGGATKCALTDTEYSKHQNEKLNPNLPLLGELKKHGVELFVCGQSLSRNRFPLTEVAQELTIAASAMTVNVNKQLDGCAYLAIH